jgi:hypothetical protein
MRAFTLSIEVQVKLDSILSSLTEDQLNNLLPTAAAAGQIEAPTLDSAGMSSSNYVDLYKKFLPYVKSSDRASTWDGFRSHLNRYALDWPNSTTAEFEALRKEMKKKNQHSVWRSKQAVCHKSTAVNASRVVEALVFLGMDALQEKILPRVAVAAKPVGKTAIKSKTTLAA